MSEQLQLSIFIGIFPRMIQKLMHNTSQTASNKQIIKFTCPLPHIFMPSTWLFSSILYSYFFISRTFDRCIFFDLYGMQIMEYAHMVISFGSSSPFFNWYYFFSFFPSGPVMVLVTFLSPFGKRQSSVLTSLALPSLMIFLVVMVLPVSLPFLLDHTDEVLMLSPSLTFFSSFSSIIYLSKSLTHLLWKSGRKSSSSRLKQRFPKKSSKMLWARRGAMVPKTMLSQFWRLNSEERALQASLTSINFLCAYSLSGLFLGWYLMASFLQALLMSSRVAVLATPSVLQYELSGLGQCVLKNCSSDSSANPFSLKNLSKVEWASRREYSLERSSSQWDLLLWSESTSNASEISWNLASAVLRCSLCLSGCHLAASFSYALSISKRVAPSETPKMAQQFLIAGFVDMGKICFFYISLLGDRVFKQSNHSRILSKLCYKIYQSPLLIQLSRKCHRSSKVKQFVWKKLRKWIIQMGLYSFFFLGFSYDFAKTIQKE